MNLANPAQARFNMIEQQIRPWNVLDADVLTLLSEVRREEFVPLAHQALAFADIEIPLGYGQCMLQDLQIQPHEKALEIGTGSGFVAALLAHRAHNVLSLERVPELADSAAARLHKLGIHNVEVRQTDGSQALHDTDRFNVILLSGSVPAVPQHLLDLLEIGGRLMAIVGDEPIMSAQLLTRVSESAFSSTTPWDANAPRLHGFTEHSYFHF